MSRAVSSSFMSLEVLADEKISSAPSDYPRRPRGPFRRNDFAVRVIDVARSCHARFVLVDCDPRLDQLLDQTSPPSAVFVEVLPDHPDDVRRQLHMTALQRADV
ncbi:hypothetical protein RPC_3058 [Rhodopseudomonas palustris BisB18]|uniref:Uncharacterized protein n=1 Tax=Rhodopseudomonas palustris (strain BisB18) TaxID=316056 RepID=Q212T4_RHOPB